ncbi:SCE4755 family polysaccharide monooxygenase-like protein [Nannocystis radixulma]|uniref:Lytic polysaccharide monooxygenase n=1 Tax=Nannocystis radixulma TaxID=2995305 RepID=A0ABT5BED4_9BACT|nr:SCE4755 family polysaccharide monooxygenase-like protein [Nannocystis radixulma]MDC0671864.1 lytic polysaccharide monooxygenase [Nannocystis radixulma]
MHRLAIPVLAFAGVALVAPAAGAHIALSSPLPRHVEQKVGPCGLGPDDVRGAEVATFQGGETIVVRWTETVDHPGHFRLSFDPEGHDDFGDPSGYDDFYSNPAVLVDEIADKSGSQQTYEQEVTLPLMSCDSCTLQLIQVMTDKPPFEVGTNDLYYQCADIKLEGVAATDGDSSGDSQPTSGGGSGEDPAETSDGELGPADEGGCGCRSDGASGSGLGLLLVMMVARRRRRGLR